MSVHPAQGSPGWKQPARPPADGGDPGCACANCGVFLLEEEGNPVTCYTADPRGHVLSEISQSQDNKY